MEKLLPRPGAFHKRRLGIAMAFRKLDINQRIILTSRMTAPLTPPEAWPRRRPTFSGHTGSIDDGMRAR
jgi:hypothetical protein